MQRSLNFAYHQIPFYKSFYGKQPLLRSFEDFKKLPILERDALKNLYASVEHRRGPVVSSGGTSGMVIKVKTTPDCLGLEWAHIHHLWKQHGFSSADTLLTMMGKKLRDGCYIKYNPTYNEYQIDPYRFDELSCEELITALYRYNTTFNLHGYPSNILRFFKNEHYPGTTVTSLPPPHH